MTAVAPTTAPTAHCADAESPTDGPAVHHPRHHWGGEERSGGGRTIERDDPASGELVARVPAAGASEVADAVAAGRAASSDWASTDPAERAELVRRGAERLAARADEVAALVTGDMGKPLADARGGVDAAVSTARQFAELGPLHRGRTLQGSADSLDFMHRVPLGVVACVVPWNDPVAIAIQGATAALVTGNTVVVKPSERASVSAAAALACFSDLPPGVLSTVLGDGCTGELLVRQPLDGIIFTGSVPVGRDIAIHGAAHGIRTVLELGGKDALVVDRDVDVEWAADQAALGCFANAGQICVAVERIYCHAAIVGPFTDALVRRARALVTGPGCDLATQLGPLVDVAHRDRVHAHVADAVERGARLRCGGQIPDGPGSFYPATVLSDVPEEAQVLRDETFGPVAAVVAVESFDHGLERAASGPYGLAATVLTADAHRARTAWRHLPVGTVKVNSVFGGAPGGSAHPHGISGNALGHGPELLDELTRVRAVHLGPATP